MKKKKEDKQIPKLGCGYCYIQGPTGPTGPGGPTSIVVGTTKTTAPGEEATVTNVGNNHEVILNFNIPAGMPGEVGPQGMKGDKGDQGRDGTSDTIHIGTVTTTDSSEDAKIIDVGNGSMHILDFYLPRGVRGEKGEPGEKGRDGMADRISIGTVNTISPEEEAEVVDIGSGYNHILNFNIPRGATGEVGPRGEKGEQGIAGPERISATYIVSYHRLDYPATGLEVAVRGRIPLERKEIETAYVCDVNSIQNTLRFRKPGFYKISFTVNAYAGGNTDTFDRTKDFVTVGFREVGTDNVYIGASQFIVQKRALQLFAQGIITVVDASKEYELVNLSQNPIYLDSPNIEDLNTHSYFASSLMTMIVEYLGENPVET